METPCIQEALMTKKKMTTAAAAGLLALSAWWPALAAAQTVKVGAVVPITGRYGAGGAQVRAGYEISVETINAAGGVTVGGKKLTLELVLLDDESDATKTVSRMETLAAQGIVAYLGGFGSDLHAAAASVAEKNKTPYLGVAFALHKIHTQGFKYLFSPFWKSPDIQQFTVEMLASLPAAERPKTAAIFQEKTDWGREMATAWVEAGKSAGYQVVVNAEYAPGAKDFSDMILKAKGAGAEVVFGLPTPPDGMTMVKQMKELGYSPKMTMMIRAPDPPIWTKNLGKDGDYVLLAPGWHHGVKAPGVKELNDAHQKKIGRPADPITGPAYACVQILAAALAKAGAPDRDKVRDAIAATDMTTVIGPVKFRPDGTGIIKAGLFAQWLDGKQELVYPKEVATKPLVYPAPPYAKR
jgi:branched-chain amino acid transport system substrate-binding protein